MSLAAQGRFRGIPVALVLLAAAGGAARAQSTLAPRQPVSEPAAGPQQQATPPVVAPGQTHAFDPNDPDQIVGGPTSLFGLGAYTAVVSATPLRSLAAGTNILARAQGEVAQYHDFVLSPGPTPDAMLRVQVSAAGTVRGFLSHTGASQASLTVALDVIDLTTGHLVKSHTLLSEDLVGNLQGALSAELSVDVGVPHGGSGGMGLGGEIGTALSTKVVRTAVDAGFDALLVRGHTYRLVWKATSTVKVGVAGGAGVVELGGGTCIPANLFEAANFLGSLGGLPIASMQMPNIGVSPIDGFLDFPVLTGLFGGGNRFQTFNNQLPNTSGHLGALGLRGNPNGIPSLIGGFLGLSGGAFQTEEQITQPGAALVQLTVQAPVDLAEQMLLDRIEADLAGDKPHIARFKLPAQFGGQLELARQIAADAIALMKAAGQNVHNADSEMIKGDREFAQSDFKKAYDHYAKAYKAAAK